MRPGQFGEPLLQTGRMTPPALRGQNEAENEQQKYQRREDKRDIDDRDRHTR